MQNKMCITVSILSAFMSITLLKKGMKKGFKNPRTLHITVANNEKQRAEYGDRMQNMSDKKESSTKYINITLIAQ